MSETLKHCEAHCVCLPHAEVMACAVDVMVGGAGVNSVNSFRQ